MEDYSKHANVVDGHKVHADNPWCLDAEGDRGNNVQVYK